MSKLYQLFELSVESVIVAAEQIDIERSEPRVIRVAQKSKNNSHSVANKMANVIALAKK